MTEKRFSFGVDIPMSWKQKTLKNERRFSDLEGFLDEDYDGEHHMLWDNQKEKWCHLDDALSVMEEEYYSTKNENEQLKQQFFMILTKMGIKPFVQCKFCEHGDFYTEYDNHGKDITHGFSCEIKGYASANREFCHDWKIEVEKND